MNEMLHDYWCEPCGSRFETWGSAGQKRRCPGCNQPARQMPGSRGVLLDFKDEGFPRAYRMWGEWHERASVKTGSAD